ncbi:MAG: NAD-dependent epimerase/dehydratase family protein [Fimbriiglobus sp.]
MNEPQRVLITGSAGRIGRAVRAELVAAGHVVIGLDRVPTLGLPADRVFVGTATDPTVVASAIAGADCLIHLAATPDDARFPRGAPPDDGDNFLDELVPNNLVAPYVILEAARKAGVKRVILASTGQVIDGYLQNGDEPTTASILPRPRYLYACTKVFLEAMGQVYAVQHGMEVLAVRLGWCPRPGQAEAVRKSLLGQVVFLSPTDAGRFFAAAVGAKPWGGFRVLYATSRYTHRLRHDLGPAERLIGFVPRDRWPDGAEDF